MARNIARMFLGAKREVKTMQDSFCVAEDCFS